LKTHFCIAFAFVLLLTQSTRPVQAMPADCRQVLTERWTAPARVLDLPAEDNLGTLEIEPDWHRAGDPLSKLVKARGRVVIPPDQFVCLHANGTFFAHPELIAKCAPNAFDCLEMKLMAMEDAEEDLCKKALGHIGHLKDLQVLILDKSDIGDVGMKPIGAITNLQYLSAFLTGLDGSCLKELRSLKKLRALVIPSNSLKEENFKYLPEYPSLQHLLLSCTNTTNAGIKLIAGCKNLIRLDISKNAAVTDESVPYIKQLKNIKDLSIDDTSISLAGLLKLKGLPLVTLVITQKKYTPEQLALVHSTFPSAKLHFRGGPKKVDEETGTIFGQFSRQRHF
jgi:hypothetical protein